MANRLSDSINKEKDLSEVVLNPDQKAIALKAAKDLIHGASYIHEMVEAGELCVEMRNNMCYLLDHYTKEICEPLGYASAAAQRIEEKHADIRKLNGRIRELEQQLGEAAPIDTVPKLLHNLKETIDDWWKAQGFGWIRDLNFGPYGTVHLKFSFLFDHIFSMSKTPVSDKESEQDKRKDLEMLGYIFIVEERDYRLVDCDANRTLLMDLLTKRFPSIDIFYWENRRVRKRDQFSLWGINAVIQDIKDLEGEPIEHTEKDPYQE